MYDMPSSPSSPSASHPVEMESTSSFRNHSGCAHCDGQTRTSIHDSQSDAGDGAFILKQSTKHGSSLRSVSAPQAQAARHFSTGDGPAESLTGSPPTSDSGTQAEAGPGGGHPQPLHHIHHHHHHQSSLPASSFHETYVYPRSALHIKFPVVDHSTTPGAAALPPRFRVAIVPQCATAADLDAALAPPGSGKRLVARLACNGSAVDMADLYDANDANDAAGLAGLRADVVQLELVDNHETKVAGTVRGLQKAGQKQARMRSGQHRQSLGSDSSSDTVVKVKQ